MIGGGDGDDERIRRRLRDLAQFGRDAQYTVSLGLDAFTADTPAGRVLRNNARHILVQVATVVEKLPESFKAGHPDIDWVAIGRMRNLIAHHYDKVDDLLVFRTLSTRIPDLLDRLGLPAPDPRWVPAADLESIRPLSPEESAAWRRDIEDAVEDEISDPWERS